jgi:four helix bundle protein
MNAAPWAGMQNSRISSVVEHSLAVVDLSRPLVEAVQRKDRDLASQLRRAISSVCLNLAEGFGCAGGNARLRFQTALGSLNEAQTALRVAIAWGYFSRDAANATLESMGALGGRIVGLVRR